MNLLVGIFQLKYTKILHCFETKGEFMVQVVGNSGSSMYNGITIDKRGQLIVAHTLEKKLTVYKIKESDVNDKMSYAKVELEFV